MEIINDIDRALDCHWCTGPLDDSVSDLFCCQECQEDWHAARTEPLQGYEEPYDLPQHAVNQIELRSPETTPADDTAAYYERLHSLDATIFARALAGNLRRERPTHNLYFASNPDGRRLFGDVLRFDDAARRAAAAVEAWNRQWTEARLDTPAHGTVTADGTIRWNLTPWQRTLIQALYQGPDWRQALREIREDAAAQARVRRNVHAAAFRRHYFNGMVSAAPREDQAAAEPDVRARALELRRNRNTGPAPRRRRPPRDLGPRG